MTRDKSGGPDDDPVHHDNNSPATRGNDTRSLLDWDALQGRAASVNGDAIPEELRIEARDESSLAPARAESDAHARRAHRFIDVADVEQVASTAYLVKRFIYQPGISLIHADPGVGKSFMALDLAFHLGLGRATWSGHRIPGRRRILYGYSEGASRLWKRRDAWCRYHGVDKEELRGWVTIYPHPIELGLENEYAFDVFLEQVIEGGYDGVWIDTWATSTSGSDENAAGIMGRALARAGRIRDEARCGILIVHHDNKQGGYRGSSAIDGYLDTRVQLKRSADGTRSIEVRTEKQRDDEEADPWFATLEQVELGVDDDGDPITSVVFTPGARPEASGLVTEVTPTNVRRAIFRFIADNDDEPDGPDFTRSAIERSSATVHRGLIGGRPVREDAVTWLLEHGLIFEEPGHSFVTERRDGRRVTTNFARLRPTPGAAHSVSVW